MPLSATLGPIHSSKSYIQTIPLSLGMQHVTTVILGGGEGVRLQPLTQARCKPAVHYGGYYRLVDFSLSNAIHSGCRNIFILTQFLSSSLQDHIHHAYLKKTHFQTPIEILPSEGGPLGNVNFQGTADAVRKSLSYYLQKMGDYVLILSGDQIYRMDFRAMMQTALKTEADLVISALPVALKDTSRLGILQIDEKSNITRFLEKPQEKHHLTPFELTYSQQSACQLLPGNERKYLGSMGIYLFKKQALIDLLKTDSREDFGKHLIPTQISKGKIAAHIHHGYWEDIGTLQSFYRANMGLTQEEPIFNCMEEKWPILSHTTPLPGARFSNTTVDHSLFCDGAVVHAKEVTHSIIGPRTHIEKGSVIRNSYLMGYDPYDFASHQPTSIGANTFIDKAIIDTSVTIGNDVQLLNKNGLDSFDSPLLHIRDGIIVVPRGTTLPDGFAL